MAGFSASSLTEEVARGLKRGDPTAQAEAYRILAPAVMGMAQRILGDRGLAEEVLQDTFISVIERASTLKRPKAAVGWVRQTAVNHCLMRLRSPWQQRRDRAELQEEADPNQEGSRDENLRDLERALLRLGPETRMVLWLHDVEGYTHKEIARVFGKTESYSKSQLARGYEKLVLDDEAQSEQREDSETRPVRERGVHDTGGKDDGLAEAADVRPACLS
jgi:RNA polymerase sigma-70 factor (ECF subfamily)